MPACAYMYSIEVLRLDTRDVVVSTNGDLVTRRPFEEVELRRYAVDVVAQRLGVPARSLELVTFSYTTLPNL
ncbi:hypothetical protein ACFVIY_17830 [Streptomyces sp. NPDC127166]|uniref:hypothetical protein n=1 Tax=Streptomyces sp. NPDC127166 TaxID=3345380 RepID=UPI0036387DD6